MIEAVERKIEQFVADLGDANVSALYRRLPAGKRLRAKLILKIAGTSLPAVKTAAIVEMIHAASLLHDDVIDDADMRRNKPSINALYGNKTAIMLGDILYSKGFFELNDISVQVAKIISNAVAQLSLGELKDVDLAKSFMPDRDAYMEMIYQKTASLIEASAGAAAVLAKKPPAPYMLYGRNLGLAFQMIDDLLDITSDSKTLGKPALHDFAEGKTTLPYIYLYEALDDAGKEKLRALHGKVPSEAEAQWIVDTMTLHRIPMRCYVQAKELIDEAVAAIERFGETQLADIALEMIDREF